MRGKNTERQVLFTLAKFCSTASVWGCPILDSGLCKQGADEEKQATVEAEWGKDPKPPAGLLWRLNFFAFLARCKNQGDYESRFGRKPIASVSWRVITWKNLP